MFDTADMHGFGKAVIETRAMHRLMRELLAVVPPDGSPWPRPARRRWVAAMRAVLDVLYEDGPTSPSSPTTGTTAGVEPSPFVDGPRPEATQDYGRLPPSWSYADTFSVLEMAPDRPERGSGRGRHARPSGRVD